MKSSTSTHAAKESGKHPQKQHTPTERRRINQTLIRLLTGLAMVLFVSALMLMARGQTTGDGRVAVSGTVMYQGKPLEHGIISFKPAKGTKGFAAGGGIKGGEYSIDLSDGPSLGPYRVQIMIGRPQRFHSEQNRVFQNIEVVVARKSRLDFHLPPK